ncbi:MAG TPA: hypothetical protein VMD56_13325 [Steroidobacteraceae bacterium]|nr:hypothetical protein [Steroidobacteraceae bacterium]
MLLWLATGESAVRSTATARAMARASVSARHSLAPLLEQPVFYVLSGPADRPAVKDQPFRQLPKEGKGTQCPLWTPDQAGDVVRRENPIKRW